MGHIRRMIEPGVSGGQFISEQLLERVLSRLGFTSAPRPTLDGLRRLYDAWCQKVPFDNLRKLIHVRAGNQNPLPGSTATDFLQAWLRFGTGGTCWAGAGALHAFLRALGFDALRGIGTMLVTPELPPNHATVAVDIGRQLYLVDSGMLHGEPLLLREEAETAISHRAWGLRCAPRDGRWHVRWVPIHRLDGFDCRLDYFGASAEDYQRCHEQTRGWSPFNYEVYARVNRGQSVVGVAFGEGIWIGNNGQAMHQAVSVQERNRILIEEVGIKEDLVRHLPDEVPTPPPPGSHTARQRSLVVA